MGESVGDKISVKASLSRTGARRTDFLTPKSRRVLQSKVINQISRDTGLKTSEIRRKKGQGIMNAINSAAFGRAGTNAGFKAPK